MSTPKRGDVVWVRGTGNEIGSEVEVTIDDGNEDLLLVLPRDHVLPASVVDQMADALRRARHRTRSGGAAREIDAALDAYEKATSK